MVENPPAHAEDTSLIPGSGRFPRVENGKPTPVFLPGKSHGQRGLVGYCRWGHKRVRHDLVTKQQQQITVRWYSDIANFMKVVLECLKFGNCCSVLSSYPSYVT